MSGFWSTDNKLFGLLGTICDIFVLHVLWVITSIPIITIGASTTALYYSCMKGVRYGEGYVIRNFFKSFKQNLKQSTVLWLIVAAGGIFCSLDLYLAFLLGYKFLILLFTIITCVYLFIAFYIFPLQAQFENKILVTIRNAFVLSIRNLPWTLLMVIGTGLLLYVCLISFPVAFTMVFIGVGLHAYLCSIIFVHLFKPYMPKEREDDSDENFHIEEEAPKKVTKKLTASDDRTAEAATPAATKSESEKTETDTKPEAPKAPAKKLSMADKVNSVSNYNK